MNSARRIWSWMKAGVLIWLSVLLVSSAAFRVHGADAPSVTNTFKVTLDSSVKMTFEGKGQAMRAVTVFQYKWQRKDLERNLSFDSMNLKVEAPGMTNDASLSRSGFKMVSNGEVKNYPIESAPEPLKRKLQDSYGVPLLTLQFDRNGRETNRMLTAGPGADDLVFHGALANATLFHPVLVRGQEEWQTDAEVSMGQGGLAKGRLTYKQVPGQVGKFNVSGVLKNDRYKQPNSGLTISKARYDVSGEHTFDNSRQEWVSGKLTMGVSFDLLAGETPAGSATGTINVKFEMLPAN